MEISQQINLLIETTANVFSINKEDILNATHDRKNASLSRKLIFIILEEEGHDKKDIASYFKFSDMRYHYLSKSGRKLLESKETNFIFNLKQIKKSWSTKLH